MDVYYNYIPIFNELSLDQNKGILNGDHLTAAGDWMNEKQEFRYRRQGAYRCKQHQQYGFWQKESRRFVRKPIVLFFGNDFVIICTVGRLNAFSGTYDTPQQNEVRSEEAAIKSRVIIFSKVGYQFEKRVGNLQG